MSRWIKQSVDDPLEQRAAVYAIYNKREGLVYVGETSNLYKRFSQHGFIVNRYSLGYSCYTWKDFHFVDVQLKIKYSKRFGEEAMVERRLIRRLRPQLNQRGLVKLRRLACG